MKKLTILIALLLIYGSTVFAQVGFNNDGSQPDPSAGVDINFPDKGLLIPRVLLESTASPNPVTAPAFGLMVLNMANAGDVTPGFYYWSGSGWMRIGNVYGSGIVNYIPRWVGPNKLANSQLYEDNSGYVGIGTTTPSAKLEIAGTVKIADGTQGADKVLTSDANGLASWQNSELTELVSAPSPAGCYQLTGAATTGVIPNSVAISGNYAYVANLVSNTMTIYDVSNPSGPVQVGSVSTGVQPFSVAVSGNFAYVANKNSNTMTIYDVSNPDSPFQVGLVNTGAGVYPVSIAISGNYAYVANTTSNTMAIYDVSNPASPFQVGSVSTGDYPNSVAVSGNYAYVANFIGNSLTIYLVSNPSSPVQVSSVSTGAESYPTSVAVSGIYAYMAISASNIMTIYNVSNPASPIQVGAVSTGAHPNSVAVSGNYAYVANYGNNSMTIYDVSVPASSTQVGFLSTGDYPNSVAVSVNYAYVANTGSNTMQIFSITCPQNIIIQGDNVVLVPPTWYTSNDNIYNANSGNVGIGTSNPAASAALDVSSTSKGFLPPRMTTGQRNLISSPATGLSIYNTTQNCNETYNGSSWVSNTHYIGESYGGGIVFYVYDNGQHGLIAATADQSSGNPWYNGTYRITGTSGDGLNAGAMNTAIIVATQMADYQSGSFAAKVCADYSVTVGGVTYGDWYLPSKNELSLLYLQKNVVGGFANNFYWSSSEYNNENAWAHYFTNVSQSYYPKNNNFYVRAVRAF